MAEPVPLSELSDIELAELLRAGFVPGESPTWTVGQLIEVERRGTVCLESDPELQLAVDEYMLDWVERFRTTYQAALPTYGVSKLFRTVYQATQPAYDVSKLLRTVYQATQPTYDVSKLLPKYDVSKLFPIYEAPKRLPTAAKPPSIEPAQDSDDDPHPSVPIEETEQSPDTAADVDVDDHVGEDIGDLPIESEIVKGLADNIAKMLAASVDTNLVLNKMESGGRRGFWVVALGVGVAVLTLIVTMD